MESFKFSSHNENSEPKEKIKVVLGEIKGLKRERSKLGREWSRLVDMVTTLDKKYPRDVTHDNQGKFRGDRSFYTTDDKKVFEGLQHNENKRRSIGAEITKLRFEAGLDLLEKLNQKDVDWQKIDEHLIDEENPLDILRVASWKCSTEGLEARVRVSYEKYFSFMGGMKKVAEKIGDQKASQDVPGQPSERDIPYGRISLSFRAGPKTLLPSLEPEEDWWPGVGLTKKFSHFRSNESDYKYEIEPPLDNEPGGYKIKEESVRDKALKAMIDLGHKLKIDEL